MQRPAPTKSLKSAGWGGRREGAGRPNKSKTVNHMRRERVDFSKPLHITQRLKAGVPNLRRATIHELFHDALIKARASGLRVLHYSILSNHIHMIVEAPDNKTLRSGMCSFTSVFAKAVLKKFKRGGGIFNGRYHLKRITSPLQMRRTLEYVLLNYCKHAKMLEHMDPYSSMKFFGRLRELLHSRWNPVLEWEFEGRGRMDAASVGLSQPQSWLAREGWRRVP